MKLWRELLLAMLMIIPLMSCSNAAEKSEKKPTATRKGEQRAMKTYYMGRFAIDVPADFTLEVQSQEFRYAEVKEIEWPVDLPRDKAMAKAWDARMAEIHELRPPQGISKVIVKIKDIENVAGGGKGILYYNNYMSTVDGCWEVLVDVGPVGLWVKLIGLIEYEQEMLTDILEIGNSYKILDSKSYSNGFYLQKGVIDLPYLEQERTYARFQGPMEMVLRVEMEETHKVEKVGLLDRLAASLAINFAPGVDVDEIRTGNRGIAGLVGQEAVVGLTDRYNAELFFAWNYQGKENSGEHPEIKIGIESADGSIDKKLECWDKILNSFRLAYK